MGEVARENRYKVDVRNMERDELLKFLYEYIEYERYLIKRSEVIEERVSENTERFNKELDVLDSKFKVFYNNHLKAQQSRAKEKVEKTRGKVNSVKKWFDDNLGFLFNYEGNLKFRYYTLLVYGFLILTQGREGLVSLFFTSLLLSGISYMIVPGLIRNIFNRIIDSHCKKIMDKAIEKDLASASKKGITEENIKEKFGYKKIEDEINDEYYKLQCNIQEWEKPLENNVRGNLSLMKNRIPAANRKLDHIIYMYEQTFVGANDSWKEAINDLKIQLRHEEIAGELRTISNEITKTNKNLISMSSQLNRRFDGLADMVSSEIRQLNSHIGDLYGEIDMLYY